MNTTDIFAAGLGLTAPWYVTNVELKPIKEGVEFELHISVDFEHGATFNILDDDNKVMCDANGQPLELKAIDTVERTWRHLNFFQYKTGVKAYFKNAETIIDKFHVIKHANEAVDTVRKEESKAIDALKRTKIPVAKK